MPENELINKEWSRLLERLSRQFADGETLSLEAILFLIGVQELGKGFRNFTRDDKVNLMHIGICRILEPYGYYTFDFRDKDGWPHYSQIRELSEMTPETQNLLLMKAVLKYFK